MWVDDVWCQTTPKEDFGQTNPMKSGTLGLDNPWRIFAQDLDNSQLMIFVLDLENSQQMDVIHGI